MTDERVRERGPYVKAADVRAEVERDGRRVVLALRGRDGTHVTIAFGEGYGGTIGALLEAASWPDGDAEGRFAANVVADISGRIERPGP